MAAVTIGLVGSRRRDGFGDYIAAHKAFFDIYEPDDTLVSGGCPKGGDRFAERLAAQYDIPIIVHRAEWHTYGRGAGFKRNTYIARDADILIAVVAQDRTGGTEDTIRKFIADRNGVSGRLFCSRTTFGTVILV